MEKTDYTDLDRHILNSIGRGNRRFVDIHLSGHSGKQFTERQTDRRLQALRKKGKIQFNSKVGWTLVEGAQ